MYCVRVNVLYHLQFFIKTSSIKNFLVLMEMSNLLNTGLDSETLVLCVKLCEAGVNPEALASVIKELRRESLTIKVSLSDSH